MNDDPLESAEATEGFGDTDGGLLGAPLMLLFRPRRFFRARAYHARLGGLLLAAWMLGIQRLDDTISTQFMSSGGGAQFTWQSYLTFLAIIGMFTGLIIYGVLGWWYRIRLVFCGVTNPDGRAARAVYLYSSLVVAIPVLGMLGWSAIAFDTPWDAWQDEDPINFVFSAVAITAMGWAIVVSWRGVRGAFPTAKPIAAVVWFLVLPAVFVVGALAIVVLSFIQSGATTPPDLRQPQVFESKGFRFRYPANWTINIENADHDPNFFLEIREPNGGYTAIEIMYPGVPIEHAIEEHWQDKIGLEEGKPMRRLSQFQGYGYHSDAEADWHHEMFLSPLADDYAIEITFVVPSKSEPMLRPGLELILGSLRAVPTSQQAPDLTKPRVIAFGPALVRYPSNWSAVITPEGRELDVWTDNATFWLVTYPFEKSLEEEISITASNQLENEAFELEFEEVETWGPLQGYGRRYTREDEGVAKSYFFFAGKHGDADVIEIGIVMNLATMAQNEPGTDFIRDRLQLGKPPDGDAGESPD